MEVGERTGTACWIRRFAAQGRSGLTSESLVIHGPGRSKTNHGSTGRASRVPFNLSSYARALLAR